MKPKLLTTLVGYDREQFLRDSIAGGTVALVALPLSIAIAIASGAPPAAGLVTAVVGGFLISALGGSRVQIGGPTGAFIVVVYSIIARHGLDGLLLATLMAGGLLVLGGLLRAGRLIRLIPEAVIEGFTIGIAVVIAVSQVKDLAGLVTGAMPAEFGPKLAGLWAARATVDWAALALGLATVAGIALVRRFAPQFRARAVVVLVFSALAFVALPSVDTVTSRFGELPHGLPWPSLPPVSWPLVVELAPAALTIALLAGIESLLSALVADRMIGGAHRSSAELLAQGAANLAAPLFGGLPATGAIARTATNVDAGGRTPVAGMVHALLILLAMVLFAPLAGALALPALAGLLVVTAWNMSEPHRWPERLAMPKWELGLLLLTAVLTVMVDLTIAIATGTAAGLAIQAWQRRGNSEPAAH
ncbi:SulP family inorganic anion transporter [Altererythrobacter salegens]|uniref:SulP family inorganic anion transporter n=1 Tax=Croceibacterium salegens TaxID=1737568 RepID=A0A6I4SZE8_9SPHN|nr:SulP family inorganic anion transporter [Croceibacterium salegens]MXO60808.1 SulP family inorganic anion transporter [Croceibacterium salegens]